MSAEQFCRIYEEERDFCRAQSNLPGEPRTRMIHIALPKPDRDEGQAAPMNWVLNPESCHYMLNVAPWIEFNLSQAHKLNSTLSAVMGVPVGEDITKRPANIDCGG